MDRWQINKTVTETMAHMFQHGKLHDVTFIVGVNKQPIRAHKLILAARSPVFEVMFCGHMPETDSIDIKDIDVSTFKELLRYVYMDKCDITLENVTSLMYGAHKYDIPPLLTMCREFLLDNASDEDVCDTLQHAKLLEDKILMEECLKYIMERAEHVLPTSGFMSLPREILSEVIVSDRLESDEDFVYTSCLKWAKKYCLEHNMGCTIQDIRSALGDVLYLIRFPLMNMRTLDAMRMSGELVLDDNEYDHVRMCITKKKDCSEFNMKHRLYRVFAIERFGDGFYQNWVNGRQDAISFVPYREAYLVGVGLFAPCEPGEVSGHIRIFCENSLLLELSVVLAFEEGKYFDSVMFNHAVRVKKHGLYTIVQNFSGVNSYFGQGGKSKYVCSAVMVDFKSSPKSTNGTFEQIGQIFRLFLKVPK